MFSPTVLAVWLSGIIADYIILNWLMLETSARLNFRPFSIDLSSLVPTALYSDPVNTDFVYVCCTCYAPILCRANGMGKASLARVVGAKNGLKPEFGQSQSAQINAQV